MVHESCSNVLNVDFEQVFAHCEVNENYAQSKQERFFFILLENRNSRSLQV